ncbi:MAG: hypothetical protein HGB21_09595 [Nitrospirae bacterium]|nr:hypothetical protein [Nitrospirota bacterium]
MIVIIPPTGGTRIDASAAAAAKKADHEKERDADEDVYELVVYHGFFTQAGEVDPPDF